MNQNKFRYVKTTCPHCKKKYELKIPLYRYYQYREGWEKASKEYGYDSPEEMMVTEYFTYGKTFNEIGKLIGVTAQAVRKRMIQMGYKDKFRKRGGAYNVKKIIEPDS